MLTPAIQTNNATVYCGNNLEILPTLPDNSVDSIITDPPYELGFMGKAWDNSGIAYSVELWQECLRVLKPGGHLLAFGGSRTWHRLAVAIEDAGFEMRDSIAWIYGSGFPKSHNISKAIDKNNGKHKIDLTEFGNYIKESRESKGWSKKQLDDFMKTTTAVSWWEGRVSGVVLPSKKTYQKLKELLELDNRFDNLIDWAEAQREVIGKYKTDMGGLGGERLGQAHGSITISATDEAKKWDGWGTALKPAFEPVVVARKPLIGTVAENVLQFGVGGINIDASRIAGEVPSVPQPALGVKEKITYNFGTGQGRNGEMSNNTQGRWPANVILDETTAKLLDEQSGNVKGGVWNNTAGARHFNNDGKPTDYVSKGKDESVGGASRFFYVAKASKRDRNEGLDELPEQILTGRDAGQDERQVPYKTRSNLVKNIHPTVKPTQLMKYLIKLVTPEGGIVLDPFTGSGSTGKAAILENYKFIGIELTAEYLPIIQGRLQHAEQTLQEQQEDDLFS